MTDFHTHILPGMDDGSRSVADSLEMLRREAGQGIRTVAVTPHFYPWENSPAEFLRRRTLAWQRLEPLLEEGMPRILLGAEVQYFEGICTVEEIRDLRIRETELLLVEMPFCRWSERMIADLLELNNRPGIRVVLAHVERYFSRNPGELWDVLAEAGLRMQCNVSFLANWRTRRKALEMLKQGQIRFLGSDCHNLTSRPPDWNRLSDRTRKALELYWKAPVSSVRRL